MEPNTMADSQNSDNWRTRGNATNEQPANNEQPKPIDVNKIKNPNAYMHPHFFDQENEELFQSRGYMPRDIFKQHEHSAVDGGRRFRSGPDDSSHHAQATKEGRHQRGSYDFSNKLKQYEIHRGVGDDPISLPYGARHFLSDSNEQAAPDQTICQDYAVQEGRRLFLSLPKTATKSDVEIFLLPFTATRVEINKSPDTGLNPGYCFCNFESHQTAKLVIKRFNGNQILGTPVRVSYAKPRSDAGHPSTPFDTLTKTIEHLVRTERNNRDRDRDELNIQSRACTLYVGNLPYFDDKRAAEDNIRSLFHGFNVDDVSSMRLIRSKKLELEGTINPYYTFVRMTTIHEALASKSALDGVAKWGAKLRIDHIIDAFSLGDIKCRLLISGLPPFEDHKGCVAAMVSLFRGHELREISRLFPPKEVDAFLDGNHCYCFVELAEGRALDIIQQLDFTERWGGRIRVKKALDPNKLPSSKISKAGVGKRIDRGEEV